jgi:chemotaxis protein MotB
MSTSIPRPRSGRPAPPLGPVSFRARFPEYKSSSSTLLEEGRKGSAWSVPWSDLMMVMFILFLVLFIFTTKSDVLSKDTLRMSREVPDLQGRPSMVRSALIPAEKNMRSLHARLEEDLSGYSRIATVSVSQEGNVLVALQGESFFAPGKAELSLEALPVLEKIARVLSLARNQVIVAGFSDFHETMGETVAGDLELSALRAVRVICFFTEENELLPEMFVVQGFGSARPLVPAAGRSLANNQRVEITITDRPV